MDKYRMLFEFNNRIIDIMGHMLMIKRLPILIKDRKYLKQNKELLSKRKHDVCYIIGTGPSLKTIDLTKLDGDTIVTNMFYKYEDASKLQPDYYLLVDEQFYIGEIKKVIPDIVATYPDTNFLLNGLYRKQAEPLLQDFVKTNYLYMWNGSMSSRKRIDCSKVLPAINNVVNIAICVALYMNYKEIILLGCDFTSFVSAKNSHCYEDGEDNKNITLAYELYNYSLVAEAHLMLEQYARKNRIQILNATQGSLIDAYTRINSDYLEK